MTHPYTDVVEKITIDVSDATPVRNAGTFHVSPDLTIEKRADNAIVFTKVNGEQLVSIERDTSELFDAIYAIGETGV